MLNFTDNELGLIRKYRRFYEDLDSGRRKPTTKAQKNFVNVCQGFGTASTVHEKVWIKYKKYLCEIH
jgi:uncharacterized protein YifE (UPF0438 family)